MKDLKNTIFRNTLIWWHGMDKKTLFAILILKAFGLTLIAAAGPASSERIGVSQLHFLNKQMLYISLFTPIMLFISALPNKISRYIPLCLFTFSLFMMTLLPFFAEQYKGAKRWIYIMSFCMQPSEFLKASYIFVLAMMIERKEGDNNISLLVLKRPMTRYQAKIAAIFLLHCLIMGLLLIQPDFGMALTISFIASSQFFATSIRLRYIVMIVVGAILLCSIAIVTLPHVSSRVKNFLYKEEVGYQLGKSLQSYERGGLYGVGLGEGKLKYQLPDSHCDFIFAVAGEEMGGLFCIIIIFILGYILYNGFLLAMQAQYRYQSLSIVGMQVWIAFQSIFNIGVTLNVFPTKGINLPFISYGGSALLAFDIAMGVYFNISREVNFMNNKKPMFHAKY